MRKLLKHRRCRKIKKIFLRQLLKILLKHLLKASDIPEGLRKLNIDKNKYLIVAFDPEVKHLQNEYAIIKYPYSNYSIVGDSLFVLKKSDLPYFNFRVTGPEEIKKYSLQKI